MCGVRARARVGGHAGSGLGLGLEVVRGVLSTSPAGGSGESGASGAAGGLAAAGGAAAGGLAFFCSLAGGAAAPSSGGSSALSRSSSVTAAETSGDLLPSPSSLSRRTSLPCASTAATTSSGDMQARTAMLRLASRGKSTEAGDCGAERSAAVTLPRLAIAGSDFKPTRLATGSRATAELTRSSIRRQLARMQAAAVGAPGSPRDFWANGVLKRVQTFTR